MIECGFFNSVNGDRLYTADQMTRPYELLVSNGVFATPSGTASDYLQVNAKSGFNVVVKAGRGIFKNKWFINDGDMLLTVDGPEISNRIDSVIVRINTGDDGDDARSGSIVIKKGVEATTPTAPKMERSVDIHEYRLADIYIGSEVTEILPANIKDYRASSDCGFITSLVQQVDTSTLFIQWEDAYKRYYEQVEADNQAYYDSNKSRFDAYYTEVNQTFDDFYATNKTKFDTLYNNNKSRFDTFYSTNSSRFDTYYYENDARFDEYYELNAETFNTWFQEIKDTAGTLTLVRLYSSSHTVSEDGQTVIPIDIEEFNNELDILQVYINGLLAVEGVDYTIASIPAESITLTNGVAVGTTVTFNIIKSADAVTSDSVIQQVARMETKIAELEARIEALEN